MPEKCLPEETRPGLQSIFPAAKKNPGVFSLSFHWKVLTSRLLKWPLKFMKFRVRLKANINRPGIILKKNIIIKYIKIILKKRELWLNALLSFHITLAYDLLSGINIFKLVDSWERFLPYAQFSEITELWYSEQQNLINEKNY